MKLCRSTKEGGGKKQRQGGLHLDASFERQNNMKERTVRKKVSLVTIRKQQQRKRKKELRARRVYRLATIRIGLGNNWQG